MKKCYAVMLFETEMERGVPDAKPNKWVNTLNVYFKDGLSALEYYANTPCPASQLIDAEDEEELKANMGEMFLNYQDENWLNENLYPYL